MGDDLWSGRRTGDLDRATDNTMGLSLREGKTRSQSPSQLAAFVRLCEARTDHRFDDHRSVPRLLGRRVPRFWELLLNWSGVLREGSAEPVVHLR